MSEPEFDDDDLDDDEVVAPEVVPITVSRAALLALLKRGHELDQAQLARSGMEEGREKARGRAPTLWEWDVIALGHMDGLVRELPVDSNRYLHPLPPAPDEGQK